MISLLQVSITEEVDMALMQVRRACQTVTTHDFVLGQRTLNKPKHSIPIQYWGFFEVVPNGNRQQNEVDSGTGMCKCLEMSLTCTDSPHVFSSVGMKRSRVGFRPRMN